MALALFRTVLVGEDKLYVCVYIKTARTLAFRVQEGRQEVTGLISKLEVSLVPERFLFNKFALSTFFSSLHVLVSSRSMLFVMVSLQGLELTLID